MARSLHRRAARFVIRPLSSGAGLTLARSTAAACVLAILPAPIAAQTMDELISEAVLPLPAHQRDDATVVVYEPDGSRTVLRQGSNAMVCRPDGPAPGIRVTCYVQTFVPRMDETARLRAEGEVRVFSVIDAELRDGTLANATTGAVMRFWSGPDRAHTRRLTVIWVPGATGASTGLPVRPSADSAWLMCGGTPRAHIMIGSTPYGVSEDAWRQCSREGSSGR